MVNGDGQATVTRQAARDSCEVGRGDPAPGRHGSDGTDRPSIRRHRQNEPPSLSALPSLRPTRRGPERIDIYLSLSIDWPRDFLCDRHVK